MAKIKQMRFGPKMAEFWTSQIFAQKSTKKILTPKSDCSGLKLSIIEGNPQKIVTFDPWITHVIPKIKQLRFGMVLAKNTTKSGQKKMGPRLAPGPLSLVRAPKSKKKRPKKNGSAPQNPKKIGQKKSRYGDDGSN